MAAMFSRGFTKPLIFILLCLVYFTNALLDEDKLEKVKMEIKKLKQRNDGLKELMSKFSGMPELIDEGVELIDRLIEYMKLTALPPGFPSFQGFMEKLNGYVLNGKNFIEGQMKEFDGEIQENEEMLRKLRKIISFVEGKRTEL